MLLVSKMKSYVNLRHYPPAFGEFLASVFLELRHVSSAGFMQAFMSQRHIKIYKYFYYM